MNKLVKGIYFTGNTNKCLLCRINKIKVPVSIDETEIVICTDFPKKVKELLSKKMYLVKYIEEPFYSLRTSYKDIRVYIVKDKIEKCYQNFCNTSTDYIFFDLINQKHIELQKGFEEEILKAQKDFKNYVCEYRSKRFGRNYKTKDIITFESMLIKEISTKEEFRFGNSFMEYVSGYNKETGYNDNRMNSVSEIIKTLI